jgi:hypothetical protein
MHLTPFFFRHARHFSLVTLTALAFTSCAQPMTTGQKSLAGAAAGAAAGGLLTGRGRGALVGAGVGAIAGALIGHAQTEARRDEYYEGGRRYPYGRFTGHPGFVYSPYRPHAVIDVRGIRPGEIVDDPATGRLFVNP